MIEWLESYWYDLVSGYIDDDLMINVFWKEIETNYTAKNRYYHNFSHIYNMFLQVEDFKSKIEDIDSFKFAIWYHDIIYKSTKKDNEEQSAAFAENDLKIMKYNQSKIERVKGFIDSTKKHQLILTNNEDNAYLLDLDLLILGTDWNTYKKYIQNIRKEYKIYPDFMYKAGRKKVLEHFFERETLYFTEKFRNTHEEQARYNLKKELKLL